MNNEEQNSTAGLSQVEQQFAFEQSMIQDILSMPLVPFLDPRLNTRPVDFDFSAPNPIPPKVLAEALYQKMQALGGIGLSANQVGLDHRMFVMGHGEFRRSVFNPKIVGASKETSLFEEGCLSIPGLLLTLKRPAAIAVSYQTADGETVVEELDGIAARIFLHEYDHMEGHNFTHHASRFKLERAALRLRNYNKKLARMYTQNLMSQIRKPSDTTGIPDAE